MAAFADCDNRTLLASNNPALLVFSRTDAQSTRTQVLVVANFSVDTQVMPVNGLRALGFFLRDGMLDLCTGERVIVENEAVRLPPLTSVWLVDA